MSEIVEWNLDNKTAAAKKVQDYLHDKELEKDKINEEREKLKKKAGKKAEELEKKWGPIN